MEIQCPKCNRSFKIDKSLIPEKGRLLQCGTCGHKWFFKNIIHETKTETANIISIVALILILDTFKDILIKIFPNIKILLNNLYETLKDISLFFYDLVS